MIFASSDGGNIFGILIALAIMVWGTKKAYRTFDKDGAVHTVVKDGVLRKLSKLFK
jgi:hypothetical protein